MWLNSVWVVWRVSGWCLEGSWMMSGWSLKLQRLYWCTNNYISSFQCNALHNAKIDRFGCAWKVFWGCSVKSWYSLEGYLAKTGDKIPMKSALFWGVFRMSVGCLKVPGGWQIKMQDFWSVSRFLLSHHGSPMCLRMFVGCPEGVW